MAQESQEVPMKIRSVWASNLEDEFNHIKHFINDHPFVAFDTEYPGVIHKDESTHHNLQSPSTRYRYLKLNISELHIIQIGLTLANSSGQLPILEGHRVVWEFNMRDFNIDNDRYAQDSIKMLEEAGIDFEKNKRDGVDSREFGEHLMGSGLVMNGSTVAWVGFETLYDFGYLIKILTGEATLPEIKEEFLEMVKLYFGDEVYDVKKMSATLNCTRRGLKDVAKELGSHRALGVAHNAGSDSLLTMQVFMKLCDGLKDDKKKLFTGIINGLNSETVDY